MTKKSTKNFNRRKFLQGVAGTAAGAAVLSNGVLAVIPVPAKETRWGFLVDLTKCIGCKACTIACKTEFDVRIGVFRASVKEYEEGKYPNTKRTFLPWLCNHCESPVCITQCPVDEIDASFTYPDGRKVHYKKRATFQRPDGTVLVDQDRCIGCGLCVKLCPYKVRYLDPVKDIADKCSLCVHRLEAGIVPSCVNTCQGNARLAGDLNDTSSKISRLIREKNAQVLRTDFGTDPQCYYVDLNPKAYDEGRDVK
jgi:tetrathionate reductase subunit B